MSKIVIIGGVAGGASLATRLRRLDENIEILMIERGEYISFANCGLPYHIGGIIPNREDLLVQTKEDMQTRFNIEIKTKSEVIKIDKMNKNVLIKDLTNNKEYLENYDYLVISTGAYPLKPNIKGINEAINIFTLRNINDMDKIKQFISNNQVKVATVIGGGFIGLEMAENLSHLGLSVNLIELANQVMAPLDYEMSMIVCEHLKQKGINLILNDGVDAFTNEGKTLILNSKKIIESDITILAIGVRPESKLASDAKLDVSEKGGIVVDDYLKTSDDFIYAIGDVIEIEDRILGLKSLVPLASPANKQARIVANNLLGKKTKYQKTIYTSIAKIFDLSVASVGLNEKTLKKLNYSYQVIHLHPNSHASYYPNSTSISIKVIYDLKTFVILGGQIVGMDGVDKRIDVLAMAIFNKMKIYELKDVEFAYAPPYSSAKDPINMVGTYAENIINGYLKTINWDDVAEHINKGDLLIDVREPIEYMLGTIPGAINLPYPTIRNNLDKLPKNQNIYIFCQSGVRSYNVARILMQKGYQIFALDGGYKTYQYAKSLETFESDDAGFVKEKQSLDTKSSLTLNACGMQCPGPIMEVYKKINDMKVGEILEVKATDLGFMKDIKTWCLKTNNTLLSLRTEEKTIIALIRKGNNEPTALQSTKDNSTIVVFSEDMDKAIAAFIIATGAASMGKKVSMFFTFWGLNILRKPKKIRVKKTLIEKMFGFMMPRGTKKLPLSKMNMLGMGPKMIKKIMKKKNVDSLSVLMENALNLGVKITACAMSMDIMGIKKEELIDNIEIAGVASYLGETTEANHNLFI